MLYFLKNYADRGRRYPPQPSALVDNTRLRKLHSCSNHSQRLTIIVKSVDFFYGL